VLKRVLFNKELEIKEEREINGQSVFYREFFEEEN